MLHSQAPDALESHQQSRGLKGHASHHTFSDLLELIELGDWESIINSWVCVGVHSFEHGFERTLEGFVEVLSPLGLKFLLVLLLSERYCKHFPPLDLGLRFTRIDFAVLRFLEKARIEGNFNSGFMITLLNQLESTAIGLR